MKTRIVFWVSKDQKLEKWQQSLEQLDFEVVYQDNILNVQNETQLSQFGLVVAFNNDPEVRLSYQQFIDCNPAVPMLFILDQPFQTDLHSKLYAHISFNVAAQILQERVENLIYIGQLHRRIQLLSQMTLGSSAVDRMFTRLDVHHILDRILNYFGSRLEMKNVHWVRWASLEHLQNDDIHELSIQLESVDLRSPHLMSLHPTAVIEFATFMRECLTAEAHNELLEKGYCTVYRQNQRTLMVLIRDLNQGQPLGFLIFESLMIEETQLLAVQMQESLKLMTRYLEFGLTYWDSQNLAMVDDLTNLYNQRYLSTVLNNEIRRSERRGAEFSVLFLDVDHFKAINDTKGHWIGSRILQELGRLLKQSIRSCDFAFRYGGDEFVLILPDTPLAGGQIVAERVRASIEKMVFLIEGHSLKITASIGIASYPQSALTSEEVIHLADEAMYFGKRKSRNIVYVAS